MDVCEIADALDDSAKSCPLVGGSRSKVALNFRDMADVWTDTIQEGRVYRCSQFYSPQLVRDKGIQTILDLRRMKDCCKKEQDVSTKIPSACQVCWRDWQSNGVADPHVLHVDLISTALKLYIVAKMPCKMWWDMAKTVYKGNDPAAIMCPAIANNAIFGFKWFYAAILDKSKESIAKAMRVFVDPCNFPILIHCVHGKDRTGLIVMLLLSLCGVPKVPIMTDYAESDRQLKKGKQANELQMAEYLQQDSVLAAMPRDCEGALNHIEEKYGTVADYLSSCGLTAEEIQKIRMNMLIKGAAFPGRTHKFSDRTPLYPTRDCDSQLLATIDSAYTPLLEFQPVHYSVENGRPLLRQSSSAPHLPLVAPENSDV